MYCSFGYGEARDLHAHLLEDDELEGVAEGLSAGFDVVRSMLHAFRGRRQHSMHVGYAQRSMTCASHGGEVASHNHHCTGSTSSADSDRGSSGATSRVPLYMLVKNLKDATTDVVVQDVYININTTIKYNDGYGKLTWLLVELPLVACGITPHTPKLIKIPIAYQYIA